MMEAVIVDQPDSQLLGPFEGRECEEVFELDAFRHADKVVIQEKSQRLGGIVICTLAVYI